MPSAEFTAIHLSIPVVGVISPRFHDCVIAFLLHQGFQLLLLVAHAEYIGVDAGVQFLCLSQMLNVETDER